MNNLVLRTLSGVGIVVLIVLSLLLGKFFFAGFMICVMSVMMMEFFKMTMDKILVIPRILALLAANALFLAVFLFKAGIVGNLSYALPALILLLAVNIASLYEKNRSLLTKLANIYTALIYIACPVVLSNFVVFERGNGGEFNAVLLLSLFIMIWSSDVGAFLFGISFGKNSKKLFPSVSPKKTWVGFIGGLVSTLVAIFVLQAFGMFLDKGVLQVHLFAIALIVHIVGVYGDLYESQWKRLYDKKDSGSIIPGHGGFLDRFDSALLAMPAAYIYMLLFGLI